MRFATRDKWIMFGVFIGVCGTLVCCMLIGAIEEKKGKRVIDCTFPHIERVSTSNGLVVMEIEVRKIFDVNNDNGVS